MEYCHEAMWGGTHVSPKTPVWLQCPSCYSVQDAHSRPSDGSYLVLCVLARKQNPGNWPNPVDELVAKEHDA